MLDPETNADVTIDSEHFFIHQGKHFFVGRLNPDVDSAAFELIRVKRISGGKECHLSLELEASKNGTLEIFEGPTFSADGTAIVPLNNNRDSARVSDLLVNHTPTVTNAGTLLIPKVVGSDTTSPQGARAGIIRSNEIELKDDTEYLIRFTSLSDNNRVSTTLEFYHPNMA